ncbi:Na+/H+ antiporter NhaA [Mycolicibacterium celeriflavum]|uniref:Na(+)/H(+) antiporter NhaA n=1 Tax=Mycolicibacterium celeriflavum TaxID=1249101 RepID=A0A7I7RFQ7_MYCCF|nr:Na+/H+ antiporter NhaA [Mycolicibacterium celeriflavum]MCV7239319.1 Na+/H+ antiporter NhaA [Mycolicibacterium celeriflavum]BBY43011.1 Na(+)/H(+) antiporter NhaA [Mycolicibacterium celeriflavum]
MPTNLRLLARGSWAESQRFSEILRKETVGGILLLVSAGAALVWANSPWSAAYRTVSEFTVGPGSLHLDLSVSAWAADGLLAIFFFVVGLELKREFVAGDLRDPRRAALPIAAAVGGMIVPAAIYLAINAGHPENLDGWAVPIATDIAFALAVLAVLSTHLPTALRTFLLTLAVVDDLLAITVIAVFFTEDLSPGPLALALIPIGLFGLAVQRGIHHWWLLLPLAVAAWALVHASGVHATVAGVVLGFTVPVLGRFGHPTAELFEHTLRPLSAGFAVPVFAFFAAGVTVGGWTGLGDALLHPITDGVIAGLVIGKPAGVWLTAFLLAKFTHASLDDELAWRDVLGVALLAGIGFTVSLLIGELAFGHGTTAGDDVKIGVLVGSVLAGVLASVVLLSRNAAYRRIEAIEAADSDRDGVPDIYQARPD